MEKVPKSHQYFIGKVPKIAWNIMEKVPLHKYGTFFKFEKNKSNIYKNIK